MKNQDRLFTGGQPEDGEYRYATWKERPGGALKEVLGYEVDVDGYVERLTPYLEKEYRGKDIMNWRRFALYQYHQRRQSIEQIPADSPWHVFSRLPILQKWLIDAIEKDDVGEMKAVLAYGVEEQARCLTLAHETPTA